MGEHGNMNVITNILGIVIPDDGVKRIGIYTLEERKKRLARFHEKRSRRIWRKKIKYGCRKKLADNRPRVKGRFVKRDVNQDEDYYPSSIKAIERLEALKAEEEAKAKNEEE